MSQMVKRTEALVRSWGAVTLPMTTLFIMQALSNSIWALAHLKSRGMEVDALRHQHIMRFLTELAGAAARALVRPHATLAPPGSNGEARLPDCQRYLALVEREFSCQVGRMHLRLKQRSNSRCSAGCPERPNGDCAVTSGPGIPAGRWVCQSFLSEHLELCGARLSWTYKRGVRGDSNAIASSCCCGKEMMVVVLCEIFASVVVLSCRPWSTLPGPLPRCWASRAASSLPSSTSSCSSTASPWCACGAQRLYLTAASHCLMWEEVASTNRR